jgi:hypothetical protein
MPKIRDLGITTIYMSGGGHDPNTSGCEGASCGDDDEQSGCEGSSCLDDDHLPDSQSGCEGSSCVPDQVKSDCGGNTCKDRSPRNTSAAEGFDPMIVAQLKQQLEIHIGN